MYTIEEVKEFISLLESSNLSVLDVRKEDGSSIRLEKPQAVAQAVNIPPAAGSEVVGESKSVANNSESTAASNTATPVADGSKLIKSPIVGVFYVAPSPDSKPYVSVGKKVNKGDTVCIVEAMKCMNEIQAEESGEVVEVLANNGELVEYGQPLFRIV